MIDPQLEAPEPAAAPATAELGIGQAALLSLATSVGTIVFSVARSKITAIYLGPEGIGTASLVLQLVALAAVPAAVFTGPALVSALAEARTRGDVATTESTYRTALTGVVLVNAFGGLVAVLLGFWLLPRPWGPSAWPLTLLGAAAGVGAGFIAVPPTVLTAYGDLRRVAIVGILVAAVSAVLTVAGTVAFRLPGQFAAAAIAPWLLAPFVLRLSSRAAVPLDWRPRFAADRAFLRRAFAMGTTSLVAGFAMQGTLTVVRWTLDRTGGEASNGQYQAATTIGATYFGLVLASLGNFAFPRYAAARDADELQREVTATTDFVLRVAPPVILLALALRADVIHLLYSHRFDPAIALLGCFAAGDLAKGVSWALGGPLLLRGRLRMFLLTEVVSAIVLAVGTMLMVPRWGLLGAGYAYVATYVLYLPLTTWALARACGVPADWRRVGVTWALTLLAMVALWWGEHGRWAHASLVLLAIVWWVRTGDLQTAASKVLRRLRALRARL